MSLLSSIALFILLFVVAPAWAYQMMKLAAAGWKRGESAEQKRQQQKEKEE